MSTPTANLKLPKPDAMEEGWGDIANEVFDGLDAAPAVGWFAPTAGATPLTLDFAPGSYVKADGTVAAFAGASGVSVPTSATTRYWLTDAGSVASGASWPTAAHLRLASVTASGSAIATLADARTPFRVAAPAQGPYASSYVGTSTTLGASPSTADLAALLNSLIADLKLSGAIQ